MDHPTTTTNGGRARAAALPAERRAEIASAAARARWASQGVSERRLARALRSLLDVVARGEGRPADADRLRDTARVAAAAWGELLAGYGTHRFDAAHEPGQGAGAALYGPLALLPVCERTLLPLPCRAWISYEGDDVPRADVVTRRAQHAARCLHSPAGLARALVDCVAGTHARGVAVRVVASPLLSAPVRVDVRMGECVDLSFSEVPA